MGSFTRGGSGVSDFTPIQNIIDRFKVRVVGTDAEVTVLDARPVARPSATKLREDEDARFTIRLNYPTSKNVTVNFETADRTAVAGQDYAARSGSVVIPAGQRRVEVDVDVLEDAVRERDETFVLRLTGSSNAPLSSDTAAEATIEANDWDARPGVARSRPDFDRGSPCRGVIGLRSRRLPARGYAAT